MVLDPRLKSDLSLDSLQNVATREDLIEEFDHFCTQLKEGKPNAEDALRKLLQLADDLRHCPADVRCFVLNSIHEFLTRNPSKRPKFPAELARRSPVGACDYSLASAEFSAFILGGGLELVCMKLPMQCRAHQACMPAQH